MRKYLVYGDEPYLVDQFRRELTGKVEIPEFNYWRRVNLQKLKRISLASIL